MLRRGGITSPLTHASVKMSLSIRQPFTGLLLPLLLLLLLLLRKGKKDCQLPGGAEETLEAPKCLDKKRRQK